MDHQILIELKIDFTIQKARLRLLGQMKINSKNISRFLYFFRYCCYVVTPRSRPDTEMKYTIRMHESVPSVSSGTGHQLDPDHTMDLNALRATGGS